MFNTRLREMRIKRNFTQPVIAEKINVSLRTYQRYEEGSRTPSYELLVQLADILDVPTDYLLGRDDYLKSLGVSFDEH